MRRRIILFLLAIVAVFGITACKSDPYSKMKLTVSTTRVNLSLREVNKEIVSDGSVSVSVVVKAPSGISSDIVLPHYGAGEYGNEYVIIDKMAIGNGEYRLDFTARKQEHTEIQVKTMEGYLSQIIDVTIDVALDSLSFKNDASVVVELGSSYDFNLYGKSLLNFSPSYTTQTNVRFTFPSSTLENAYKRRGITLDGNKLTVDANAGAGEINVIAVSTDNESIHTDYNKALSVKLINPLTLNGKDGNGVKNLSATLIDTSNEINNIIVNQVASTSTASNVYYNLTFANPNIDGVSQETELKTIFGGHLKFEINRADYKITLDGNGNESVDITSGDISKENGVYKKFFVVDAKELGEYTAVFKVDYVGDVDNGQYDGLYTKYIYVKIFIWKK